MAGKKELNDALDVITRYHNDISILHCVSQYPTHPDNLNLNTINYLKKHYGQYHIGFSDHTIGISAPAIAVGMGAEIIEKHITIDRHMKGPINQDHSDLMVLTVWFATFVWLSTGLERKTSTLTKV